LAETVVIAEGAAPGLEISTYAESRTSETIERISYPRSTLSRAVAARG
jgi:hypothetical protein